MKISAVIITKNEEENLDNCLKSLEFCDEVILVDDFSRDKTTEIAKNLGVKVFQRKLGNDFSSQRNFGLEKAGGEYVLFLDADEIVSEELKNEIKRELDRNTRNIGFYLKRKDVLWGKTLRFGETGGAFFLRLLKRGHGKWERRVHEKLVVGGKVKYLRSPIYHFPHRKLSEFVADINFFSTLHSQANTEERKRATILKIVVWPKLKFLRNYFFKLGFLDGTRGFLVSMIMSFHSFLAWSKQWIQKERN